MRRLRQECIWFTNVLLLQKDTLLFRLSCERMFTSSNCILVADPSATSEGTLYSTYSGFIRTDVLSSQYNPAMSLRRVLCFVLILVVQTQRSTTTRVADPVGDGAVAEGVITPVRLPITSLLRQSTRSPEQARGRDAQSFCRYGWLRARCTTSQEPGVAVPCSY